MYNQEVIIFSSQNKPESAFYDYTTSRSQSENFGWIQNGFYRHHIKLNTIIVQEYVFWCLKSITAFPLKICMKRCISRLQLFLMNRTLSIRKLSPYLIILITYRLHPNTLRLAVLADTGHKPTSGNCLSHLPVKHKHLYTVTSIPISISVFLKNNSKSRLFNACNLYIKWWNAYYIRQCTTWHQWPECLAAPVFTALS